uniref:ZP domain-containing protein n=1 Tax=Sinocyclocheilus grahami TaxID=75366 RepID=A0A672MFC0_SINGR
LKCNFGTSQHATNIYLICKCILLKYSIFILSITVAFSSISSDPCYNYESLDRPWRANNESGVNVCDERFSWNGWYRLFYYGMNIQMPETCVSSCNTEYSLWLSGPHPQIEDGVVIREVCGYYWGDCCYYKIKPIRVKACSGNYYVYELVNPQIQCSGYCTGNVHNLISFPYYDPCNNYNILDNHQRSTRNYRYMYGYAEGLDDTRVEWDGWYRLFIDGSSAQMPEWCASFMSCGGYSGLYLGGSHPRVEDGVVTREIYGSHFYKCSRYRSEPIQVKACPGNNYVYKFTRPTLSIPAPVYCAVSFSTTSVDPCYNYTSLSETWRAIDYSNIGMCENNVEWNGWYRLFYNGQNTRMPESCVNYGMCGTYYPLSLNGPHPQLEDGVVIHQVCFSVGGCCTYTSHPIRVKACPGNYYVYEFVKPMLCGAYCLNETSTTGKVPVYRLTCIIIKFTFPQLVTLLHYTLKNKGASRCHRRTFLSKWFHKEPLTSEEPFCFTKGPLWRKKVLQITKSLCPCCIISFILWFSPSEPCAELSCTEDEWCGEKNGVYGCLCNENQTRPDSFDFSETCESSSGSMSVSRCQLFEAGFPADVLHLNDPSCKGTVRNGRVEFHFDNDEHICGTNLLVGYIIHANEISFDLFINISGLKYKVPFIVHRMQMCDDLQEITFELNVFQFKQFDLLMVIVNILRCPNANDDTVELLQNGVSTSSRFSFRMFIFTANSSKLYLHCAVHLCLLSSNRCSTDCNSGHQRRERRSLDFHDSASISMGPLMLSEGNTEKWVPEQVKASEASSLCGSLMLILAPLMSVLTLF